MPISITKTVTFDSAHQLYDLEGSKCQNLHGHTYKLEVTVSGKVTGKVPMVMDLHELKLIIMKVIDQVDHQNLNILWNLDNPTAEVMLNIFKKQIQKLLPAMVKISKLVLWETPTSCATWTAK